MPTLKPKPTKTKPVLITVEGKQIQLRDERQAARIVRARAERGLPIDAIVAEVDKHFPKAVSDFKPKVVDEIKPDQEISI